MGRSECLKSSRGRSGIHSVPFGNGGSCTVSPKTFQSEPRFRPRLGGAQEPVSSNYYTFEMTVKAVRARHGVEELLCLP